MRYTFSEEEEEEDYGSEMSDAMLGARRSTRNSGVVTPADPSRPTVTASGRHVRSRLGGVYGESLLSGQSTGGRASPATEGYERSDGSEEPVGGRPTRNAGRSTSNGWQRGRKHIETYNSVDEMDDEDDASSSGGEWDGGDEEEAEIIFADEDDEDSMGSLEEDDGEPKSMIITLQYRKKGTPPVQARVQAPQIAPGSPISGLPSHAHPQNGQPTSFSPAAPSSAGFSGITTPAAATTVPVLPSSTAPIMSKPIAPLEVVNPAPSIAATPQVIPVGQQAPVHPAPVSNALPPAPVQPPIAPIVQVPEFPAKSQPQQYPAPVNSSW
jgi:hypothetical protein